jgi:hypothetical protein
MDVWLQACRDRDHLGSHHQKQTEATGAMGHNH